MDRPKVAHWKRGLLSLGAAVLFGCGDSSPTGLPQADFADEPRRLVLAPSAQPIQFIEAATEPLAGDSGQPDQAQSTDLANSSDKADVPDAAAHPDETSSPDETAQPEEASSPNEAAQRKKATPPVEAALPILETAPPVLKIKLRSSAAAAPADEAAPGPAFKITILSPSQVATETLAAETLPASDKTPKLNQEPSLSANAALPIDKEPLSRQTLLPKAQPNETFSPDTPPVEALSTDADDLRPLAADGDHSPVMIAPAPDGGATDSTAPNRSAVKIKIRSAEKESPALDSGAPPTDRSEPQGLTNGPLPPVTQAPSIVAQTSGQPLPLPTSERWRTPLPVPQTASAAMAAVNGRAKALVAQGCQLGERGAVFSARTHFIQALRLIAESLDLERATEIHTRSLAAGLTALREVRDFQPKRSSVEDGVDLALVVSGHRTPVLKQTRPIPLTAVAAQQRYLNFAHEQLTLAAGGQPAASAALYALGRVAAVSSAQNGSMPMADAGQVMVYYQAALMADARNFLAANELGVLLAEHGRLEMARDMFAHCVSIKSHPIAWQNLASMYTRLGKPELAANARSHVTVQSEAGLAVANLNLKLLDPETFAQTRSASDSPATTQPPGAATAPSGSGPASSSAAQTPGGHSVRR